MENKEQQILDEIRTMMASLRQQMEMLDAKMAQLQQLTQSDDENVTPIVLDIDAFAQPVDTPSEAPTEEQVEVVFDEPADDLPFDLPMENVVEEPIEELTEDLPEEFVADSVIEEADEEAGVEEVGETLMAQDEEPQPVKDEELQPDQVVVAEPESELEPESEIEPEQVEEKKTAVQEAIIDVMTDKQAWRTDMPGTPVKDVRLAISLHERVLFINHLFSEDPMTFQATVNKVNASESLDQVVEYVKETFPQWNLESDLVYRFMMAVRRKIR